MLGGHRPPGRSAWHLPTHTAALSHPDTETAPQAPLQPSPPAQPPPPPRLPGHFGASPVAGRFSCRRSDVSCQECGTWWAGPGTLSGFLHPEQLLVTSQGGLLSFLGAQAARLRLPEEQTRLPTPRESPHRLHSHSSPGGVPSCDTQPSPARIPSKPEARFSRSLSPGRPWCGDVHPTQWPDLRRATFTPVREAKVLAVCSPERKITGCGRRKAQPQPDKRLSPGGLAPAARADRYGHSGRYALGNASGRRSRDRHQAFLRGGGGCQRNTQK